MTDAVAIVLDDFTAEALPGLERDLAHAGAMVMRSFRNVPGPHLLRRHRGAALVGGPDRTGLLSRLELATATLSAPVIAVLPRGMAPDPELRGPGVVDLIPAGTVHAAERVLLMARVPIVTGPRRPWSDGAPLRSTPAVAPPRATAPRGSEPAGPDPAAEVLAVASSTGGVWVLAAMLRSLRPDRVAVVAQHLENDFVPFFAEWLQSVSGWRTTVVSDPVPYARGVAYVAAGGLDLVVEPGRVRAAGACGRYVPNGDRLLRSAGEAVGRRAVGVVLSGMGADGTEGLAEIARRGGRAICQDPATAAVASMPECALRRTASAMIAAPGALAAAIGPAQAATSADNAWR